MAGRLVFIVGPSGAGKDTLLSRARLALANDPRFVFPRRTITRPQSPETEDFESIDPEGFRRAAAEGAFALTWQAHGLSYGLPASLRAEMALGRIVVVNGSRDALAAALPLFPQAKVVSIIADQPVIAARLQARGRETPDEIARRLARASLPLPAGFDTVVIDNSGALALAEAALLQVLLSLP